MKSIAFFFEKKVLEIDLDYTDENCKSSPTGLTCAQILQNANYTGAACNCSYTFELKEDFTVNRYLKSEIENVVCVF